MDTSIIFQQRTWAGELEGRCWINATPGRGSERGFQSEPQLPWAGPGNSSFATSNNYGENFCSQASPGSAPKPGAGGSAPSGGRSALRQAAWGVGGPWDDRPGGLAGITQPWGLLPESRPNPRVACCCPAHCLPPALTSDRFPAKSTTLSLHSPPPSFLPKFAEKT